MKRRAAPPPGAAAPTPHPSGAVPPPSRRAGPAARRDRHGRQRPLGEGARAAAHRRPREGESSLFDVVEGAIELGVGGSSAYAFSTENWKRSARRGPLPHGLQPRRASGAGATRCTRWGVRVRWAGRRPRLWRIVVRELEEAEELTRDNDVCTLTMCVNYGGRAEIADAARALALDVAAGRLDPAKVNEKTLARYLDEPDLPDVDLFLRSSGEQRTSNFLLWQSAYAELVFLDELWPDVDRRHAVAGGGDLRPATAVTAVPVDAVAGGRPGRARSGARRRGPNRVRRRSPGCGCGDRRGRTGQRSRP